MFGLFRRPSPAQPVSPSDAARALSQVGRDAYRERVRAMARQMRADLGMPPHPALEITERTNHG